jgi:hypothetical protein
LTPAENTEQAAGAVKIVVWGPPQSGKTLLVASLKFARPAGWDIDVNGEKFQAHVLDRLEHNRLPEPTQIGGEINVECVFRKLAGGSDGQAIRVEIEDRRGLDWEYIVTGKPDEAALHTLATADAGILLYDLAELGRDKDARNLQLLEAVGAAIRDKWQGRENTAIAVCLTKADCKLTTADAVRRAKEEPEISVQELISKERYDHLAALYLAYFHGNVKFFPVSSLGLRMVFGAVCPVTFTDENGEVRLVSGSPEERAQWQINLTEPFLWLFGKLGLL